MNGDAGTLAGLKPGMQLTLRLAPDRPAVIWLNAVSPKSGSAYIVKVVDADKRTLTVTNGDGREMKSLTVARDARLHRELLSFTKDAGATKTAPACGG